MVVHDSRRPLLDWRVLVTRPVEQAQPLIDALQGAGATAIAYPTIALGPPPTWTPFDEGVARLSSYDWLVFTSPSAVRFAFDRVPALEAALHLEGAPAVAAVGSNTAAALARRGVAVALVPDDERQEGLVAGLAILRPGARVLFPRALAGRDLLREALERQGVLVDVVPVSETRDLSLDRPPPTFDVATFASPSALRAFLAAWSTRALADRVVAVLGPTTAQAAIEAGVRVQVVSPSPSVTALVSALSAFRAGA